MRKHRLPPFEKNGILLVDKSKDWTSFDVVNVLKNNFNIAKIGHCGTLDPNATGLLVIVIGRYTKRSESLMCDSKVYEAEILLGKRSNSLDIEGEIIAEASYAHITHEQIEKVVKSFLGEQMQIPPMMSAIKIGGKKLYQMGRKGEEVVREPRPITIYELEILSIELPYVRLRCHCSKGTYIRSLADDIGQMLGCGALLSNLRRTQSGRFRLEKAPTPEMLKTLTQESLAELVFELDETVVENG